jgi:cytochrome c2
VAAIAVVVTPAALVELLSGSGGLEISNVGMAVTYCAAVLMLTLYTFRKPSIRFGQVALVFLISVSCFFLFLLMKKPLYSRPVLLIALGVSSAAAVLPFILRNRLGKAALFVLLLTVILSSFSLGASKLLEPASFVASRIIRTSHYNLLASYHLNFALQEVTGGAISTFGDRYLLVMGDGQFYLLSWDPKQRQLSSQKLSLRVPLNRDEFARDTSNNSEVSDRVFRTADLLVQDFGENFRLFASHHYWNAENHCFTIRVSATQGSYAEVFAGREPERWETIYESTPCLGLKSRGDPFAGYNTGGQLALIDDSKLLLTVGDHKFDGLESDEMLPQDKKASYGKTILIDLHKRIASIYTIGHRNAQGLYVDEKGVIWSTEHGPKGGDELNVISAGKNYGWPLVTYGTDYDKPFWPLNAKQGWHGGFELPAYAWIPSIGVSALTGVRGDLFKNWQHDLLVSSLANRSFWRMRVDHGRVIFAESIQIGWRIRDIIEDQQGRIVLWTEEFNNAPTQTSIIIIEPAATDSEPRLDGIEASRRGEILFARCVGCHSMDNGTTHAIGPDLKGMFERPIAGAPRFRYSKALKAFSGNWTEEKLDAFLANPQEFAPGTSMQAAGIEDPATRARLIEYLRNQS